MDERSTGPGLCYMTLKSAHKILVTGKTGFIGKVLSDYLGDCSYEVVCPDRYTGGSNTTLDFIDITDYENVSQFINIHKPDIIIHCAGIAHQKIGRIDSKEYFRVNSYATQKLAQFAITANPDVYFIFLSSISVYGEDNVAGFVSENEKCDPSSDYAKSKFDAEKRLMKLFDKGFLKKLDILRLAPVYDSAWSLNLDRRVFALKKAVYLKFGSGRQQMSAVARQNLVDFIAYRLTIEDNSASDQVFCNIFNVCDAQPYEFQEIIEIFKQSDCQPNRVTVRVPLPLVFFATRFAGVIFHSKQQWLYSCYNKLARSLVFDNTKMLDTGFKPRYGLESVFLKNE